MSKVTTVQVSVTLLRIAIGALSARLASSATAAEVKPVYMALKELDEKYQKDPKIPEAQRIVEVMEAAGPYIDSVIADVLET